MFLYSQRKSPKELHALAALCLYDQSFGFTHDEAKALALLPDWLRYIDGHMCPQCDGTGFKMSSPPTCIACGWKLPMHPQRLVEHVADAAEKIAALLPPTP